ncbi:MAG: hypothetical protein JSU75_05345 [Gammaproteobacteria bacterium]|nr:MAG: hypothetical protein JSU75_05345 [Gammaproteobacteria bacterium]
MPLRCLAILSLMAITLLVQGCASREEYAVPLAGHNQSRIPLPAAPVTGTTPIRSDRDHFIAWIPRRLARTATVAEALVQVEWGNAKEQASADLCNGAWLMNGEVTGRAGPYPTTAPEQLGGYAAWYYHVSHKPGFTGCAGIDTQVIYRVMRSSLPDWIIIRTAAPGHSMQSRASLLD